MPILFLAAAAALASQSPRDAPTLTRREALTLPADVLARRLLGEVGALYSEVERPVAPDPLPMGQDGLRALTFATTPEWSGYPGICIADVVTIGFQSVGERVGDARQPVQVNSLAVGQRFRIVSDAREASSPDGPDEDVQRRLCDGAGPVLAPDRDSRRFFMVRGIWGGSRDASFIAGIVQQALDEVARGELAPTCPVEGDCAGHRLAIGQFDVTRIARASVDRCPDNLAEVCVWADMIEPGSSYHSERSSSLRIRTDASAYESGQTTDVLGIEHFAILTED